MFDRLNISDMDKFLYCENFWLRRDTVLSQEDVKCVRSVMSNKSISTNESKESETNDQSAMDKTDLSSSSKYGFIIEKNGTH